MVGFVALVPWLRTLDRQSTVAGSLLGAWAMSVAFTAAAFAWFASAIGHYTQLGPGVGMAVLLLAAPVFQPQFLAFALVRHLVGRRHGTALRAVAAASAWVATEALVPRLLDDTLGYGLHPSRLLRQAADLGGTAGLTLALLLANEAVAAAVARWRAGVRPLAAPAACAVLVPLLLAGYGLVALRAVPTEGRPLRLGLVQANITDYERLRREKGAAAVVREVLDTHFAMSYDAVERQHADAVLWSETVYPTTFGHPKSDAGAELDREILAIVDAARVPFVFGTYDRDAAGEYNAAAFVVPGAGLLGLYRKTRLFPLTEHVPAWLDSELLRRWLPWTGGWQPGSGARVFPLRLADGREIPVLPLVCLDDVDAGLAIDGARLGAQAILTLSNDAWFPGQGAWLHHAAATFRSVETRLPQFRVTTDGYSAVIDAAGDVVAGSRRGERTLVVAAVPVAEPPRTLMVAWGDWVGRAGAVVLLLLAAAWVARRWIPAADAASTGAQQAIVPARIAVLPAVPRLVAALLRTVAGAGLLWLAVVLVLGRGPVQAGTFGLLRTFALLVLVPQAAAWCVLRAYTARASLQDGALVFERGRARLRLAVGDIAAVEPWRWPLPTSGAWLRLASGGRWPHGLAVRDAWSLARALAVPVGGLSGPRGLAHAQSRAAVRHGRLHHPLARFVLLPLLLAIPAFRLHQHIAYGSAFGEYLTFGLAAYLRAFALWWASWAIGTALCAAVLRAAIEAALLLVALLRPAVATPARRWLERAGLVALYVGLPAWLALRLLGA